MESILLPGRIWRESEFVFDPNSKRWLTGTCGPNAIAMAQSWADQYYHSTLEVYQRLRAAGRCAANGAATLAHLAEDVSDSGYPTEVLPYSEPMPESDWRAFLERHAGRKAVILELACGQALVDSISGKGENCNPIYCKESVKKQHRGKTECQGRRRVCRNHGRRISRFPAHTRNF